MIRIKLLCNRFRKGYWERFKTIARCLTIIAIVFIIIILRMYYTELIDNDYAYNNAIVTIQTLAGILALIIASEAARWMVLEPKFDCVVVDQHGSLLKKVEKEYLPLGINKNSQLGYMPYSPSDWEINIINTGRKNANNVKIEITIEGLFFKDASIIYDVKNFEYGYGVFNTISFDTRCSIKQNDILRLPKIPFQYSECDLKAGEKTKMHIYVLSDDKRVSSFEMKICIEEESIISCDDIIDETIHDPILSNEIKRFIEEQSFSDITIENYFSYSPYECCININNYDIYRRLYNAYVYDDYFEYSDNPLTRNIIKERMKQKLNSRRLFWGRVYYKSLGYTINEVENILTNDMKQ